MKRADEQARLLTKPMTEDAAASLLRLEVPPIISENLRYFVRIIKNSWCELDLILCFHKSLHVRFLSQNDATDYMCRACFEFETHVVFAFLIQNMQFVRVSFVSIKVLTKTQIKPS